MPKKHNLKPISFHGHELEGILKAFMQVDPQAVKDAEEKEKEKEKDEKSEKA